ncbi:type I secretion system permease/ATPase [Methylobacterium soli]|uniref:Type I secretion system permease/ATPase n=1 Tax=Methylobacterium soli TaxID=553447 RepID=A0A6L3T4L4_9HYPH|nr:type I secretion system permease/ATPase [Methylobacterium soli]KAB1081221.1 type I secretion system permease/ATPase [Methylobacterium soli]GJE43439.1 Type I secretion system ATP-binding protein PrsD [Methylobacterium soli]
MGAGPSILKDGIKATRPVFVTAIVFSFFINLLMFVSPLYMLQVYDRVLGSRNETTLVGITVIAAFALVVYALLEMLRSRLLVRGGILFDEKIAGPIFGAVHRGNLRNPEGGHAVALRDVDAVREFLTGSGLLAFCDAPWTPIFLLACFILHPWFGWMAIAGGLMIFALTILNEVVTKRELAAASQASNAAGQYAQATFRNGEVLQAMGMLGALRTLWGRRHAEVLTLQALASDRAGLIVASTKFVRMFLQTLILGVGAYLAIHREISPGSMIAASIIIGRALAPVELLVANWKGFTAVRSSYGRLVRLIEIAGPEPERMNLPRPKGQIDAENLVVTAPGKQQAILRGVSFRLTPGTIVGVVGPSAAGKSSLARAVTGVWPIVGGSLRIDGSDLSHWDPQVLGRHIGYLPQDVELFAGTVAQNIARFEEIDEEAVISVAQKAGCHELIQSLPEGYNTQIGNGGQALSGGQRQRIALARAMYGNPSFIVLDEPNASLDAAGEEALMQAVQELKRLGTTIMIVTHKVNILTAVDTVLVMNSGTVQAYGPREEILGRVAGPRVVPNPAAAVAGAPAPRLGMEAQRAAG